MLEVGDLFDLPLLLCRCRERLALPRDSSRAEAVGDFRVLPMRLVSSGPSMSNTTEDYVTVGDWLNQLPRGEWVSQKNSSSTFHSSTYQLTYGSDSIYRLYDAIAAFLTRIG